MEEKIAVEYRRVSTATQTEKYGLDVQHDGIVKYCEANNIRIVNSFVDGGVTGKMSEDNEDLSFRDGYNDMITYLELNPEVKYIVVLMTSRLWRNDDAHLFIVRELRRLGVDIISVDMPTFSIYDTDPSNYLINSMMSILDTYERMCINVKLARGRRLKAEKTGQKPAGNLPYGYKYSSDGHRVEIDNAAAEIVRGIFQMRLSGDSFQHITDYLNEHDYPAPSSDRWYRTTVKRMVDNDFYVGVLTHIRKMPGSHEPLVSKEMWRQIHPDYDFNQISA